MSFAEILEAVDVLSIDERIEISNLIQMHIIEDKRSLLANEIKESEREFKMGFLQIQTVDEIMDDLLNEI